MILENCSYLRDARVSKEAQALMGSGFDVVVISPESVSVPSRMIVDKVVIYGFPSLSFPSFKWGYVLEYAYSTVAIIIMTLFLCATVGFDIIHVSNPPDCLVPAMAVYKIFGKRIIYDQHDLSPELYSVIFCCSRSILLPMLYRLEQLSYSMSDHIIVTNESYKTIAMNRGHQPHSKISVVRNGPRVRPAQMLRSSNKGASKPEYIIVFAGVTGYQDGLDYLCYGLASLRNECKRDDFVCMIVGDGGALPYVKRVVCDLELEDKIQFRGWVNDVETYWECLKSADICVSPEPSNGYNDKSTFVKVMEYMSAGKPIVAFDLPETRYTAQSAAVYVKPNDCSEFGRALATLMDDEELRRTMGTAGRERIERKLAWEYSVPALLNAYRAV